MIPTPFCPFLHCFPTPISVFDISFLHDVFLEIFRGVSFLRHFLFWMCLFYAILAFWCMIPTPQFLFHVFCHEFSQSNDYSPKSDKFISLNFTRCFYQQKTDKRKKGRCTVIHSFLYFVTRLPNCLQRL